MPNRQNLRLGIWILILAFWPTLLFPEDHVSRVDELFSRWDTTETPGCALGGYRAGYVQFPDQRFSVIILANLDALNPTDLCFRIAEIYLGHLMQEPASPDATALPEQTEATANVIPPEVLKRFAGEYVNEEAWQRAVVTFENDELRIKLRGSRYTLQALGESEFQLKNARQPVQVRFQKRTGMDHSFQMEVKQGGQLPLLFIPAETYAPTSSALKEYQGQYNSPELPATYILRLRGNRLVFAHKAAPRIFLVPFMPDLFAYGSNRIRFIRDESEDIIGFRLNAGRVRSLRFDRSGN